MTNLGKTKEEIIYEILLSLNNGKNSFIWDEDDNASCRIQIAISQYEELVKAGIVKEE